ncbi:MAG: hypothetical protein K0Q63_1148 [Paenibacillus sp.]|nr:hypothetical protein [Paenibacillus sp.]
MARIVGDRQVIIVDFSTSMFRVRAPTRYCSRFFDFKGLVTSADR